MKTFPKILTAIFVFLFIFQASAFLFINLAPDANASDIYFKPQVTIGEFDKDNTKGYLVKGDTGMIGAYIKSIYEYAIGIAGIMAAAVLMYGGFSYIMSGGSADKISEAKSWIGAALSGLVLVMLSYTILSIINPKLLDFKISPIEPVDPLKSSENSTTGCCQYGTPGGGALYDPPSATIETEKSCTKNGGEWEGSDYEVNLNVCKKK